MGKIVYFMEKIFTVLGWYMVSLELNNTTITQRKKQGRSTLMIVMYFLKIEDKGV